MLGNFVAVFKKGNIGRNMKMKLYECVMMPTVLYGCESWMLNAKWRKKLNVMDMKGLRAVYGVIRRDR